jgi:hypothetical protein
METEACNKWMKAVLGSKLKEVPKKKMLDENIHSHLP